MTPHLGVKGLVLTPDSSGMDATAPAAQHFAPPAPDPNQLAHAGRMRKASIALFAMGSIYALGYAFFVLPDAVRSHGLGCAATLAAVALLIALLPPKPLYSTVSAYVGIAIISTLLTRADATGSVALFYLWPIISLAYFTTPRLVVGGLGWMAITLAPSLLIRTGAEAHVIYIGAVSTAAVMAGTIVAMLQDQRRLQRRIEVGAQIDPVTGLLNRRALAPAVKTRLTSAARRGTDVSVVLIEIDHFKAFNDVNGHLAGDHALRRMGAILLQKSRSEDLVCRYDRQTYALVLSGAAPWGALVFVDRVATALHHEDIDPAQRLSVSCGIADASPEAPLPLEELLHRATAALQAAKDAGAGRAALWHDEAGIRVQDPVEPSEPIAMVDEGPRPHVVRRVDQQVAAAEAAAREATAVLVTGADSLAGAADPAAAIRAPEAPPRVDRGLLIKRISISLFFAEALNSIAGSLLLERSGETLTWQWSLAAVMLVSAAVLAVRPGSTTMAKITTVWGTVLAATVIATTEPLAAAPLFYVWPIVVGAYFCSRQFVTWAGAFSAAALAAAVVLSPAAGAPFLTFVATMANVTMVSGLIAMIALRNARLERALADSAKIDPLTNVLNRRAFNARLSVALRDVGLRAVPLSLIMVDADDFKGYNDAHGDHAGDELLQRIARHLTGLSGSDDLIGRFGGDKFVLALPGADVASARRHADRIALSLAVPASDPAAAVTVSVGIASMNGAAEGLEPLLSRADEALYIAKNAGRGRAAWPSNAGDAVVVGEPIAPLLTEAPARQVA